MSLINLRLENEQIINDHFTNLCCDNYTTPFLKGGQSNADTALNQLNIDKYATKRNNVYPKSKRDSSYLSTSRCCTDKLYPKNTNSFVTSSHALFTRVHKKT